MVQVFREREVQQSGQVPGYQNVQYHPDAFGAATGRAITSLGGNIAEAGNMIAQLDAEKKANDAFDVRNKATDALRTTLYDPNEGIFTKNGKNAMDSSKSLNASLDKIQSEYIDKVTDPQTRSALEKMWRRETEQAKDKVAVHEMNELGKYKVQTAKATMFGSMEDAYNNYNDDKAIDLALGRAQEAIDVNADGLPPEALALAKAEAKSSIRLAALSRWSAENPSKALDYYRAHKDDFSGKDHITATQFIEAARNAENIQVETSRIMNQGNPWLFDKMEEIESGGNTNAESPKNASGVMQIMPGTARELLTANGRTDLAGLDDNKLKQVLKDDTTLNRQLGRQYMTKQLERFGGDVEAALVAYNAGPEAAEAFLKHNAGNPPGERDYDVPGWKGVKNESEGYVKKILGSLPSKNTPAGQRMTAENWTLKNFRPEDIVAPTPGGAWVDARAAQSLDQLTDVMKQRFRGFQIKINEERDPGGTTAGRRRGTSDPKDNPHVKKSQHIHGKAFDVQVQNWSTEQKQAFISEARKLGFTGFGFYGPRGHLHIDMGPERTWGSVPNWAVDSLKAPVTKVPGMESVQGTPIETAQATTLPGAQSKSGFFIDTKTSSLDAWLADAATIEDPTVRAGVVAQIRAQSAVMDQARDAEIAATKQSAWDIITQGGSTKEFTPELLSRLDPSFVNTLTSYEEKRAQGGVKTDWGAYAQLQSLEDEELVKTDIMTEYANKLGETELKQELNRQREARKKLGGQEHDEALLANTRTRSQIVEGIVDAQGWDKKKNAEEIGQFNRVLSERILGEQAIKGGKLNELEILDIADKLLIEDKFSPKTLEFWQGRASQGPAMNAETPDEFVAASSWEEVQPDDQKDLIDYYERTFGKVPDEEEATDIYNRAMRVWLGGKPDGPEDEKTALRGALENKLGSALTDERFERAYGKYLLSFLGR